MTGQLPPLDPSAPEAGQGSPLAAPPPAKQPGRWKAFVIPGLIVAFLAVVLYVVRDNQSAGDLAVGTCFDVPASVSVSTVTRHACTEPHDAEVFHVAEYTDGSTYPISLSLEPFVDAACSPAFATYVGVDIDASEDLTFGYFYPSRDGWDDGDRTVTCYAVREDEAKLTQSVKGSS